jgi:hypothetical protein
MEKAVAVIRWYKAVASVLSLPSNYWKLCKKYLTNLFDDRSSPLLG